ncbi:LicD family protein [Clostridium transplantifaecale]|uniref:LicD family protein n=1 Tax=Clostridium transplantifaecale TaxID=2479838 RepID=UPI000F6366D6|nr:LicD family protein [Clostridium transplantifaecale]
MNSNKTAGSEQGKFYEPEVLARLQQEILSILDDFLKLCEEYHLEYFGIAGTGIGAIRHKGFIPWDDDIDIAMPRRDFEKFLKLVQKKMGDKYLVLNAKTCPEYPLMTTRLVKRGTVFIEEVMKDVDCPFGIFLDLYVLDNVSDNPVMYQVQSWAAWFVSKLMILRSIPRPTLAQKGFKAALIWSVCSFVNKGMNLLHVSPEGLRRSCEAVCRKYEKRKTNRMAFLPDTSPYWNLVDKRKYHPLKTMEFEGRMMNFPGNIEEMLTNMYGDYMKLPPVEKRKTHYPYRLAFSDEKNVTVHSVPGNTLRDTQKR